MTLEDAVKEILQDCLYWIEMNKDRGAWIPINFPSKFLHTCKLLNQTAEFKMWSNLRFLKNRNLNFNLLDGELTSVRFEIGPSEYNRTAIADLNIKLLTNLRYLNMNGLPEKYKIKRGMSFIHRAEATSSFATAIESTPAYTTGRKLELNINSLDKFKF